MKQLSKMLSKIYNKTHEFATDNTRMKYVLVGLLGIAMITTLIPSNKPSETKDYARNTVRIVNLQMTGGGTGVILSSSKMESLVLTNKHVCGVAEEGGFIVTHDARYLISEYKTSNAHDICIAKVRANLNARTEVASYPPELYSDSYVAGHPRLMPFTLVKGHFSDRIAVPILESIRRCTEKEIMHPELGRYCEAIGGIPVFKVYDAQFITNTIQPGNSGSAVYNSAGEIAGLVFASGSRELSYAIIVPQEYINNFLNNEMQKLEWTIPHQKTLEERENSQTRKADEEDLEKLRELSRRKN